MVHHANWLGPPYLLLLWAQTSSTQFTPTFGKSLGCYKADDIPKFEQVFDDNSFYGLKRGELGSDGRTCRCLISYGHDGEGSCPDRCQTSKGITVACGGEKSLSVYESLLKKPGPPESLSVSNAEENSLILSLGSSNTTLEQISSLHIEVKREKTFDTMASEFITKHIQISGASKTTTISGLSPGCRYRVMVAANSATSGSGPGPAISASFWTEVGQPEAPQTPRLITRGRDHDDHGVGADGELHVQMKPLERQRYGPITAYRVVVIDETNPAPFDPDTLTSWSEADEKGLQYYIAAEVEPDFFQTRGSEFVVGDLKFYGKYFNYGPLPQGRDFHISLGAVSTLNNVTKASYAKVNHGQHAKNNLIVFQFNHEDLDHNHDHNHDHEHDHEHHSGGDPMAIVLSVAIVVAALVLFGILGVLCYVRRGGTIFVVRNRKGGSRSDVHELTPRKTSSSGMDNSAVDIVDNPAAGGGNDSVHLEVIERHLEAVKNQIWTIPRNFLDIATDQEPIARGKFGTVLQATVNKQGAISRANVQIVPVGKVLVPSELQTLTKDLDVAVKCGTFPNLVQLVGICEDKDTLFVALEDTDDCLKQILLDSRALVHHPVFAEKNSTIATVDEAAIFQYLIGVARGMNHLSNLRICHRRLCASNVFLSCGVSKVGGFGISHTSPWGKAGKELDLTRWTAQEALRSQSFVSKCDVWSFGVLIWEAFTLGGTPYSDVPSRFLAQRAMRGLRVPQPDYVSDELYQVMLQCWQLDLDERPDFQQLDQTLRTFAQDPTAYVSFRLPPSGKFQYEKYLSDLEFNG